MNSADLETTPLFHNYKPGIHILPAASMCLGISAQWVAVFDIDRNTRVFFIASSHPEPSQDVLNIIGSVVRNRFEQFPYDFSYLEEIIHSFSETRLQLVSDRGFSIDKLHEDDIYSTLLACAYSLSRELNINQEAFARFIYSVRCMYNDVPYHNWLHAADTAQFVFSVIRRANVGNCLTQTELFALFVAAVCHDIDHKGLNNAYHRKANTILASLAPSLPPLETHHAELAVNLLDIYHRDIFEAWSEGEVLHFQKVVVMCILATDMENHSRFVERFSKSRTSFDKSNEDNRLLLAQIIMKAADLSNVVRDFKTAEQMTQKLSTEFFLQGDIEERMGLQISPMCNRAKDTDVAGGQIGFYKFVAGPLMHEIHSFFPELAENERQYLSNLDTWTKVKQTA